MRSAFEPMPTRTDTDPREEEPAPAAPAAGPSGETATPADSLELPAFARSFPDDPRLRALVEAFERGHYDVVRREAPRLAEDTKEGAPDVARAARALRARLEPDPTAVKLLAGAVILLVLLAVWAYSGGH
jgi:hypothetical protein